MIAFLENLAALVDRAVRWLVVLLVLALLTDVAASVVCRYVFVAPIMFSDQLAKLLMVWTGFLGASIAARKGAHISLGWLQSKLGRGARRALGVLALAVSIVFCAVVILSGYRYLSATFNLRDPMLFRMPLGFSYAAVPVGAALMLLQFLALLPITILGEIDEADETP